MPLFTSATGAQYAMVYIKTIYMNAIRDKAHPTPSFAWGYSHFLSVPVCFAALLRAI